MKTMRFICSYIIFISLISCQSEQNDWKKAKDFDFEYKIFKKNKDANAEIKEGDIVSFQYRMSLENGKILESSNPNTPVKITIPGKMYLNQFEAAFLLAAEGDSLTVRYKKEKVLNLLEKHKNLISEKDNYILLSYRISELIRSSKIREMKDSAYAEKLHYENSADYNKDKQNIIDAGSKLKFELVEKIGQKNSAKLQLKNHHEFKIAYVEEGKGKKAGENDIICFYYLAALEKRAKIFDENFKNGSRYCFKINKDTKNSNILHRAVKDLQKGTKAYIFVPAESGYGKTGSPPVVPPNADLVIYVEIAELIPQK